jgi:drug/metabolite transporter (DMT)-like permease
MLKYLAIPVGALLSAAAQIMLKRTSGFANWSVPWALFFLLSAGIYGLAMLVYLYLLRMHPMSKIYPIVTLMVILIITLYGFLIGERISPRHLVGLALGIGSIYLLLP